MPFRLVVTLSPPLRTFRHPALPKFIQYVNQLGWHQWMIESKYISSWTLDSQPRWSTYWTAIWGANAPYKYWTKTISYEWMIMDSDYYMNQLKKKTQINISSERKPYIYIYIYHIYNRACSLGALKSLYHSGFHHGRSMRVVISKEHTHLWPPIHCVLIAIYLITPTPRRAMRNSNLKDEWLMFCKDGFQNFGGMIQSQTSTST